MEWYVHDRDGKQHYISGHCAKDRELRRCFEDFKLMREKAKGLNGAAFGGIVVSHMTMSVAPFDFGAPP